MAQLPSSTQLTEASDAVVHHAAGPALAAAAGWGAWDVAVGAGLLLTGAAYVLGLARLWRRAGAGCGVRWFEALAFAAAWLTIAVALLSPLDTWSDRLFSAHMTQHELLMLVAAPLLVLGRPLVAVPWALPAHLRLSLRRWQPDGFRRAWRHLTAPVVVLLLHGVVVWIWHIPALFEAALRSDAVHAVQHLGFFWTAALFWWALAHGRYGRLGYGIAVLFVFLTALHQSVLGALLTFAPSAWYPTYEVRASGHAVDPVADQQLAGLLMWIPSGAIFLVIGLALFAAWLGEAERRAALPGRLADPS